MVAVLIALLLAGCGGTAGKDSKETAPKEKIIRITEANVPNIDPGVGSDYSSSIALCNLYDTLVFPNDDGTVSPLLATKWETSSDGLTWTFELKRGVKFHNGEELTAEDVAFSMQRMITVGEGYGYLFAKVVKEARAVDNYKVEFKLNKTFGPFLSTLVRLYVLDKSQVTANIKKPGQYGEMGDYGKEWLLTNDAGSGPYKVKELKKQEYLYAVKHPEYWGGWDKDAPDSFKIIGTTAASTVRTLMTRRELEITDQWQSEEALKALGGIPGVAVNASYTGSMMNIMFNTKKPPADDVHFRKALAYAFDYKTAVEKIFPGSKQTRGPVSFILPGFKSDAFQYNQDLDKAKEELAKSRYAGKLDQYPIDLAWVAEVPDEEKIALMLQSDAAKLGIKVNIVKTPWLSFTECHIGDGSDCECFTSGTVLNVNEV
ncbi:MAG: ABC transporter substrate-binding protein [Bacillota bacterium]